MIYLSYIVSFLFLIIFSITSYEIGKRIGRERYREEIKIDFVNKVTEAFPWRKPPPGLSKFKDAINGSVRDTFATYEFRKDNPNIDEGPPWWEFQELSRCICGSCFRKRYKLKETASEDVKYERNKISNPFCRCGRKNSFEFQIQWVGRVHDGPSVQWVSWEILPEELKKEAWKRLENVDAANWEILPDHLKKEALKRLQNVDVAKTFDEEIERRVKARLEVELSANKGELNV